MLNDVDNDVGAMRRSLSEEQALEHQLAAASAETSSLRQQLMEVLGSNNVLQVGRGSN